MLDGTLDQVVVDLSTFKIKEIVNCQVYDNKILKIKMPSIFMDIQKKFDEISSASESETEASTIKKKSNFLNNK